MKEGIRLFTLEGKKIKGCTIKFLSRINNDGESIIKDIEQPAIIGRQDYTIFCLSISQKKWIATDRMSTYIVELIEKETNLKFPCYKKPDNKKPTN